MTDTPTALALDDAVREAVAAAPAERNPLTIAYVDAEGWPHVSKRSSVLVLDDRTLGLWARDPAGGLLGSIGDRPRVTLLYIDFATRGVMYTLYGTARVSDAPEVADQVWDGMPEVERQLDPERRGVAVVVDLDKVVAVGKAPERNFTMQR